MKKNSFVKQASFLMIAGILVRIVGLLYRPLMKANIGELGYAYYGYAYNVYFILLLISGYSIPVAVSKLMSERLIKKEYKNAQKIFWGSLIYVLIAGGLASGAAFLFAEYLLPRGGSGAALALRVLAPTILLAGILGVLRGYFQANNNMMPTSVSQILESLVNACMAIGMGLLFIKEFSENAEEKAVYGAAGSTIGPGAGVLTGILFMLLIFWVNRKRIRKRLARDVHPKESWSEITKVILFMLTPVIFSTCVYNVGAYVNQTLFAPIMMDKGYSGQEAAKMFNQYSGMYLVLTNVPIALANASSTALIPSVASSFALRKFREVKSQINEAVRMTMVIAIPAAMGLSVLAFPIMRVLFGKNTQMAAWMMVFGGCSVIFYSLSTITNGVLQGIGQPTVPLKNAAVSLLVNVAVLVVMTSIMQLGAFPVMLANLSYGVCMCILNQKALRKYVRYQPEYQMTYVYPGLAAFAMGASAMVIYYIVEQLFHRTIISLMAAVPLAGILYFVYYVLIAKIKEEELRNFYFGAKLVWLMKKIRVYK